MIHSCRHPKYLENNPRVGLLTSVWTCWKPFQSAPVRTEIYSGKITISVRFYTFWANFFVSFIAAKHHMTFSFCVL